jgi:hypothetical protein
MSYIYHISFDIDRSEVDQLSIGKSLQNSLGYLRSLLPGEPGYITSRAMQLISDYEKTNIIFESVWETWDDIEMHQKESILDENRLLKEFQMKVNLQNLEAKIYEEIS